MRINHLIILMFTLGSTAISYSQSSAFYFVSSPQSFIGAGQTLFATPTNGFGITAILDYGKVRFLVNNITNASMTWTVEFEAPNAVLLTVGAYFGAERAYFTDPGSPGLDFMGEGNGNNTLTGWFNVLEVSYDAETNLSALAIDFVQYDGGYSSSWNEGSVRFNSSIPIPKPLLLSSNSGSNIVLSWPVLASSYTLFCTTNLNAPSWIALTNSNTNEDGTISVSVPITGDSGYFRLAR
jgi:hypothetical protein